MAAVLFIGFGVYISKAKNPFITPAFFKNTRWLMAISCTSEHPGPSLQSSFLVGHPLI